jgi:hypothetical protein
MTDVSNLNYQQIEELEKQIEERKKFLRQSNESIAGYKVTFFVKFNPYAHKDDELCSANDFGDWLVNDPTDNMINYFGLKLPHEDVSGFEVSEITDKDKEEWKWFWQKNYD